MIFKVLSFLLPLLAFAAPRPDWTRYVIFPEGANFEVKSESPSAFTITATRTDDSVPKTGTLAIANVERDMWTHNRMVMSVRSLNGKRVDIAATISHPEPGGRTVMKSAPGFSVAGRAWREVVLALDHDFALGDGSVRIKQVKIGAWIGHWKRGEEGGIEVKDFRLCSAGEVVKSAAFEPGDTFVSVPAVPLKKAMVRPDALRVFFAFDNEDIVPSVHTRKNDIVDEQQIDGFRGRLIEHLGGRVRSVVDVGEADVIVYSRCRPDSSLASKIADAVKNRGIPLFAASEVCDDEVEKLLPCKIGHEVLEDLPKRSPLVLADPSHPLVAKGGFSDASFGIYRTIAANPDSLIVMRFADGTPAVVEGRTGKGRVVYSMLAIGSSAIPGKESPDAFAVRVLSYLSSRELPEKDNKPAIPDSDGWYEGVGKGGFGRFGWETGSGLLAEDVGTRFAVKRGDAGYEFSFPHSEKSRRFTFAGDRVNQLSLGGEVAIDGSPAYRIDMSLGYPGIRWNIHQKRVDLLLNNLLAYAALPLKGGVKMFDLTEGGAIPANGWHAPWMLLFNGSEKDSPLLLVFQHRLAELEVIKAGDALKGLSFTGNASALGMVVPTWIYGSQTVDTSSWANGVPEDALKRIRLWYPRAFSYPVNCTEHFKLRPDKVRIVVRADFDYVQTADDWHTSAARYAPVSPVIFALANAQPENPGFPCEGMKGPICLIPGSVGGRGLATRFGEFADKDGASSVQYALPLCQSDLGFLPHSIGFEKFEKIADEQFASGVRFTCGGGVKVDPIKDKHGSGRVPGVFNCNMHGSLLGMCRCTPNPYIYSDENRRLMRRRMTWRMLEPLETMQYRMACRWRREPVSGSIYTIYMNSPRDISTRFEPETYGSKIIYGDSNETVRMILSCIQVLEDRMGQQGLVKANWEAISRHVASYEMCIDDWAFQASGCLEYGGPGSIDMLNSEYSCMMKLSRLAEIAGDEGVRAQALYRAARRICPTLARLKMLDYFSRTGQLANPEKMRASSGFNEQGACFQRRGSGVRDVDLFDMSQGIPFDLISLYSMYGWKELRKDYVSDVAAADPARNLNYITAAILAIGSDLPAEDLLNRLDACAANEKLNAHLPRDWPGMDTGSYLEFSLAKIAGAPRISECRSAYVHSALWDRVKGELKLEYTPNPGAVLKVRFGNGAEKALPALPAGLRRTEIVKGTAR